MTQPSYWSEFAKAEGLTGRRAHIPEDKDISGVGAEIYWFDDEASRAELEEFYPGIAVAKDGYVPVGGCDIGSGDPYFIRLKDGVGGPLYRIYHDAVREDGYSDDAVAIVLRDYRDSKQFIS